MAGDIKPKNTNSHLTAIKRPKLSFPVNYLLEHNLLIGNILDFGCGHNLDHLYLKEKGVWVDFYDPYYYPIIPQKKYDTILCIYVLNVLSPLEQLNVLFNILPLLEPFGKIYYAVRRDIKRAGFRYNPSKKCYTYQCNVILPYKTIFKNKFTEIYQYQRITEINPAWIQYILSSIAGNFELLFETATTVSILVKGEDNLIRTVIVCSKPLSNVSKNKLMQGLYLVKDHTLTHLIASYPSYTFIERLKTENCFELLPVS